MLEKEKGEQLNTRHAYLQVIGPIGVGKSSLVEYLSVGGNVATPPESFMDVTGLREFYTLNPAHYSYDVQRQFLEIDTGKLTQISSLLADRPVIQDGGRYQNLNIENIQYSLMHWMSQVQHKRYLALFYSHGAILEPDVLIYVRARNDKLLDGVTRRGREMELAMLKKHPEYFEKGLELFDAWVEENRAKMSIVTVDLGDLDIVSDQSQRQKVIEQIKAKAGPIVGKLRGSVQFPEFLSFVPRLSNELTFRKSFFKDPGNLFAWADQQYHLVSHELSPKEFSEHVIKTISQNGDSPGFIRRFNEFGEAMRLKAEGSWDSERSLAEQYLTAFIKYQTSS